MNILQQLAALQAQARNTGADIRDKRTREQRLQALQPLLAKFGPETAAQVGAAATSAQPDIGAAGVSVLGGLLGQLDPQYQTDLANRQQALESGRLGQQAQRFGNLLQALEERRSQQRFPLEQRARRLQNEGLALGNTGQRLTNEALDLKNSLPVPVLPYGKPPEGRYPVMAPSGRVEYIPQPGTEDFNNAQAANREAADALKDIHLFQQTVESAGPSGTELTGPAAATLKFQRGNIIARIAKLRNLGVLQGFENVAIEEQLPDPTTWGRNVAAYYGMLDPSGTLWDYQRQTIQQPYTAMRELLEARLRQQRQQYWYVDQVIGALPEDAGRPGGATGGY